MIVIDTSVGFKWFDTSEKNTEEAETILRKHLLGEEEVAVPDLFLYELTNAWSTKSALTTINIKRNLDSLKKYSLHIIPIEFAALHKTIEFSREYKVSVYDAAYAILAREKGCTLITADEKFIFQTHQPYIKHLNTIVGK